MKFVLLVNLWSTYGFADSFYYFPSTNVVTLLLISFYITSIIFTFIAYKEFKSCAEPIGFGGDNEANQELGSLNNRANGGAIGGYQPSQNVAAQVHNIRNVARNSNFSAFRGQGVRLGGA